MVTPVKPDGEDESQYQPHGNVTAVSRGGTHLHWFKATEGLDIVDRMYADHRAEAAAAGDRSGAYHFARVHRGQAVEQATKFFQAAKLKHGDLFAWLDLETNDDSLSPAEMTTWAWEFCHTFIGLAAKAGLKTNMFIYTHYDLGPAVAEFLLAAPSYSDWNGQPRVATPWKHWDIWQFSDGKYGVPNSVNGVHGDLDSLRPGLTANDITVSWLPRTAPAPGFVYPPSETRIGFTGHIINWRLKAALEAAERRWGHEFTVIKGCFLPVDKASGSTHHGTGVCDIEIFGDPNIQVACLRAVGIVAWHRTTAQGFSEPHIHCVLEGDPGLDPEAAAQVVAYHNGHNGLANNGPDDSPRPNPIPVFTYPPKA